MKRIPILSAVLFSLALPAWAEGLVVVDAYARAASPAAKAGAAFVVLRNEGAEDDRLVAVESDVAMRVELHTHVMTDEGVMQMRQVEGGLPVPAGAELAMERGGDHIMFMGLVEPLVEGKSVDLRLKFESGAELDITVPVDLDR